MLKNEFWTKLLLGISLILILSSTTLNYSLTYFNWRWQGTPMRSQRVVVFENTQDCTQIMAAISAARLEWNGVGANFSLPRMFKGNNINFHGLFYDDHEDQIGWLQPWPEEYGDYLAKTMTWFTPGTHDIKSVDTVFNDEYTWSTQTPVPPSPPSNAYDVQSAMTHEFGHWAGLWHSPDPDQSNSPIVMRMALGPGVDRRNLEVDDKDGLFAIYNYTGWAEECNLNDWSSNIHDPDIVVGKDWTDEYPPNITRTENGEGNVIHTTWTDDSSGNYEVYYRRHLTGGNHNYPWEFTRRMSYPPSPSPSGGARLATHRVKITANPPQYEDHVYLVWVEGADGINGELVFQKSIDGGMTWLGSPTQITHTIGNSIQPAIAVTPDNGLIHIVWADNTPGYKANPLNLFNYEIFYMVSVDDGVTWSEPWRLTYKSDLPDMAAISQTPAIAVDTYNSVYVVWSDNRGWACGENVQIYYARSPYGELPWSPDLPVTSYQDGYGCFQPSILVHNMDKVVHLVFVRLAPPIGSSQIYYLRSTDYGNTWGGEKILTDISLEADNPYISSGEIYFEGATYEDYALYVVAQGTNQGHQDIFYAGSIDRGDNWDSRQLTTQNKNCLGVAVAGYLNNISVLWSQEIGVGLGYNINYKRNRAQF
jgi:hypothetical protein